MHNLYPGVMTAVALMALDAALSSGSSVEFMRAATTRSAEVTSTITTIQTRIGAASSGGGGSSSSFGGGFRYIYVILSELISLFAVWYRHYNQI